MSDHRFPAFKNTRVETWEGKMYAIRDVWHGGDDGGYKYGKNVGRPSLARCEYATLRDGKLVWTPCIEGVMYSSIEPFP